jgi:hypothetical protein
MNPIRPEEGFLAETPEGGVQFQTALRGGFGRAAAEYAPETKAGVEGVQVADASADLKALEALGGGKMDDTYRDVLSKRSGSDNLKWLEEYGASRGLVEPQGEANGPAQPQSEGELWKGSGLKPGSMFNAAGNVAGDVFGGLVTEGASTYLGHAAKGLQNTVNGLVSATGGVSGWLEKNGYGLPGGLQVTDPETGAFDPKLLSTEEFQQFQAKGGSPEVSIPGASLADQNQTVTGNLVGGMVQFLTGLGLVGKATGGLSTANTVGGAAKRVGQYYLADLAAWDGQEGNLANFVQSYPALQNPIAEWLATDEETPELEGRLKNAIAGAVPNAITEVTLQWLKGVKEARRLKSLTKSDTVQEAIAKVESGQAQIQRPTVDSILGNPADDLLQRPQPAAVAQAQPISIASVYGSNWRGAMADPARIGEISVDSIVGFDAINGRVRIKNGLEIDVTNGGGTIWGPGGQQISPAVVVAFKNGSTGADWTPTKIAAQAPPASAAGATASKFDFSPLKNGEKERVVYLGNTKIVYAPKPDGSVSLITLHTEKGSRNQGGAQAALKEFTDALDASGMSSKLTAIPYDGEGGNKDALRSFYGSFGYSPENPDAPAKMFRRAQSILKPVETGVPDQVAAKSLLPGSHKAPDIAQGMKRVYRVEPKGSATLPVEEYIDDLATAQAELKAKNGGASGTQPKTLPNGYREFTDGRISVEAPPLDDGLKVREYWIKNEDGKSVGYARLASKPNGGWEVSHVSIAEKYRGNSYAQRAYKLIEQDLGISMRPSGVLTDDGYRMWQKKNADGLQHYRRLDYPGEGMRWISPQRMMQEAEKLAPQNDALSQERLAKINEALTSIPDEAKVQSAADAGAAPTLKGDHHIVYQDIPTETQASGSGRYEVRNNIPDQATGAPQASAGAVSDTPAPAAGNFSQDVYINWSRINTADDVKSAMGQMADAMQDEIKTATRGKVSNAQTAALAGDENAWALLLGERKGNIPNAHEQLAMRKLWASSGQKLLETAKLAATGGDAEMYAFRKMMAIHNTVQQTVIGVRSETARALQQWRMPAGPESTQLAQMKLMLETGGGSDVTKELATKLALLGDDPQALDVFVRKSVGARTVAAVREYWINALLSNPKTHIVNVTSNGLVFAQSLAERMVAGHLAGVLDPVDGVKSGEALYMMMGAKESLKDALSAAVRVMKTGESTYARSMGQPGHEISAFTPAISAEAFDVKGNHLAKAIDMIGSIIRVPGTAMQAGDEFFKIINSRAEIWAQALRMASEEVERGQLPKAGLKARIADIIANPPDNILMKAADMASYNTFTSEPDAITKSLLKLRNQIPGGMMVMPFVNTPSNILKFSFERTPLAPLVGRFRADIAAGGARRDLALAKIGLGSLVMSVGYDLAMDGHLSGGGPEGDKRTSERQAMARAGWQRYSMRVMTGQDADGNPEYRYFAYNRLDPVGMYLGMAADMADMARNMDLESAEVTQTFEQIAVAAAFAAADNMMDKTYLSGFATFVDAIREPGRYGDQFFKKLAGSMVPAVVAEGARQIDPYGKQAIDMIEQMKSRVPYLSKDVPNRLNMWGDPVQYSSGLGNAYDAFSPVASRTNKGAEPIEREFFKLNYFPPDSVSMPLKGDQDGNTLNLSLRNQPEIVNEFKVTAGKIPASKLLEDNEDDMRARKGVYRSYVKVLSGLGDRTMKESLNDLVTGKLDQASLDYEAASSEDKVEMIGDIMRAYRGAARAQVQRNHPELQDMRNRIPSRAAGGEQAPF